MGFGRALAIDRVVPEDSLVRDRRRPSLAIPPPELVSTRGVCRPTTAGCNCGLGWLGTTAHPQPDEKDRPHERDHQEHQDQQLDRPYPSHGATVYLA